jgi:hypothetical protein
LEVEEISGQLVVHVGEASLSELFTKLSIDVDQELDPESISSGVATKGAALRNFTAPPSSEAAVGDGLSVRLDDLVVYDRDGSSTTTNDQVRLDGSVTVNATLHFEIDSEDFHLTHFVGAVELSEEIELAIKSQLEASLFEGAKEFAQFRWRPIVIWVGWVPVVLVPEVSLVARAEGSASLGIEVSVRQASTAIAGAGFDNGSWHPISDVSASLTFDGPTFTAGANISGRVGPRFQVLIFGVAGPRVDVAAFGELDIDLLSTPVWQVFGGLEASVGVLVKIVDRTLADVEFPGVIQYRRLLGEGGVGSNARIVGAVRDAITRQPLASAFVSIYRDGDLVGSVLTTASGEFSIPALPGAVYAFDITRSGYLPVRYENVTVLPNEIKTLDIILQIDVAHAGVGSVSGSVFDAVTGLGVPNLTVRLRPGINVTLGTAVATATTGSLGAYSVTGLQAGNYTAEASGTGYATTYFSVICIGDTTTGNQNGVISPLIPDDQTRIVLTWGATPPDLDSHFTGPLADGTRFHMFYVFADSGGGSAWPSIVRLDRDDTTSFGPETTTLLQQIDGVYRFTVHDFTNRSSTTSAALSASQAQVRVYRGSDLFAIFNVPLDQAGTLWTVFEIEGPLIRPINTMGFESNPGAITKRPDNDYLFESLPEKIPTP